MTLPESGTISLQDIIDEFEGPGNLTSYYRGGDYVPDTETNSNIPTSGTIKITDFYGTSSSPPVLGRYLVSWGDSSPVLGLGGSPGNPRTPVKVGEHDDWDKIFQKWSNGALARRLGNGYYTWGVNNSGQLGLSDTSDRSTPTSISLSGVTSFTNVSLSTLLLASEDIYATGSGANRYGNGSTDNSTSYIEVSGDLFEVERIAMAAINSTGYCITTGGFLLSSGQGTSGALGNGATNNTTTWGFVTELAEWKDIICRANGSNVPVVLAIKSNGTLWRWGGDFTGTGWSTVPVQIGSDDDWDRFGSETAQQVSVFIFKDDGSLWARGTNGGGQLGVGSTSFVSSFTEVSIPSGILKMTGGLNYTFMLLSDGTLWGSGNRTYLGEGVSSGTYTTFTQIGSDSDWLDISSGGTSTLAIKGSI